MAVWACPCHAMLPLMLNPHNPLKVWIVHHCPLIQRTADHVEYNTRNGKPH